MKMLIAVAVAISGAVASYMAPSPTSPGIDHFKTSSVKTSNSQHDADHQYSVSNLAENHVCILKLGHATTAHTSTVKAGVDCDDVWPHLSDARNWTENTDGTVTLSMANGEQILQLAPGDGNAFEAFDPPSAPLTLTAVR